MVMVKEPEASLVQRSSLLFGGSPCFSARPSPRMPPMPPKASSRAAPENSEIARDPPRARA